MLHTVELPVRNTLDIDEEHHQISGYCDLCLNLFKGGNIMVKEDVIDEQLSMFTVVDINDVVEQDGDPWIRKTAIGFAHWSSDVDNLDDPEDIYASNAAMCFGMSERLRWKDVELSPKVCLAPNIDRLREALKHIYVCAWCPLAI